MGDIQKEDTIASLTSLLTQYTVQMDQKKGLKNAVMSGARDRGETEYSK